MCVCVYGVCGVCGVCIHVCMYVCMAVCVVCICVCGVCFAFSSVIQSHGMVELKAKPHAHIDQDIAIKIGGRELQPLPCRPQCPPHAVLHHIDSVYDLYYQLLFTYRLDRDGLDLLHDLLQYQSSKRVPAGLCMKHPFFSSLPLRIHDLPNREYMYIYDTISVQYIISVHGTISVHDTIPVHYIDKQLIGHFVFVYNLCVFV